MPEEVRNLCRLADISSKSLLLQVVRQDTPEKMTALIEKIDQPGRRDAPAAARRGREAEGRPSEALRVRVPAADESLQSETELSRRAAPRATKSSTRWRRSSASCAKPSKRQRA